MPGALVRVDLDSERFQTYLQRLQDRTEDLSPVLRRLAVVAIRTAGQKFARQGPGWRKLSPRTLRARRKGGKDAKILQDTGRLRQSIVGAERGGGDSHYNLQRTSVEFGSNLAYAAIHQFGGVVNLVGGQLRTLNFVRRGNRFQFSSSDGKSGRGRRAQVVLQARHTATARSIFIPARPYLPTANEVAEEFEEVLADYLGDLVT